MMTVAQFIKALDKPYAWPGGYPRYFIMADGAALSFKSAEENQKEIIDALINHKNGNKDWQPVACEINWEDDDLRCAHSNEKIECAYSNK